MMRACGFFLALAVIFGGSTTAADETREASIEVEEAEHSPQPEVLEKAVDLPETLLDDAAPEGVPQLNTGVVICERYERPYFGPCRPLPMSISPPMVGGSPLSQPVRPYFGTRPPQMPQHHFMAPVPDQPRMER